MSKPSAITSITQIPGVYAAHYTNAEAGTGCTVIVCPEGATGAVDVRGGAPATRETDLLRPEETVQTVHAVVLSGGSAFGLAASCGVAEELERRGIGFDVGMTRVPIVNSACLFDLGCGKADVRPTAENGAAAAAEALAAWGGVANSSRSPDWNRIDDAGDTAVRNADERQKGKADAAPGHDAGTAFAHSDSAASSGAPSNHAEQKPAPLAHGNVGAGTGCTVGKVLGPARTMKSGLGEHVETVGDLVCGAVAAVNAAGDIVDPDTGAPLAGLLSPDGRHVNSTLAALRAMAASSMQAREAAPRTNTTISCVVTNARLTKAQATKVAQMSADAYAHALRPTHTTNDGDTIFVLATNQVEVSTDLVGITATRALELAIADAGRSATTAYGFTAACDLQERPITQPADDSRPLS